MSSAAMTRRAVLLTAAAMALAGAGLWRLRDGKGDGSPREEIRAVRPGRPVVFVGLDGADWQLLDELIAEGAMSNLAELVRAGRPGVLETLHPPLSPLVWTTMMTGVSPLEHGVLDFTRFHPATGAREPVTSAERRVPAVWTMATLAGRRVAVFGLWATWPAEPVAGLMVSDRLFSFQRTEREPPPGVVHPPEQERWAREALAAAEAETGFAALAAYFPWLTEEEYRRLAAQPDPYAHPVTALRRVLVETAVYHRLASDWLVRERPDLAVVYFQGSDAVGHLFAPYAPPRQPAIDPADVERYGGVPRTYYSHLDRLLGEYRDLARRQGAVLMLGSDHGFLWREGRPARAEGFDAATAGRWHRDEGIYLLHGPGISPGPREKGGVAQVCATLLALLGLPPGEGLAGPPLPGSPPAAGPAVDYRRRFRPVAQPQAKGARDGEEELAKLRALGYVGDEPARSGATPPGEDPTRTAGSFNNEGLILRAAGRTAEAAGAFERAVARDPGNASALWNLSDLLAAEGRDPERADDLLVRAVAADLPDGVDRVRQRAAAHRSAGRAARALALLDRATAARPGAAGLWLLAGRQRVEGGDCRAALAAFERAVSLAPEDPLAHGSAALARLCLGDAAGAARDLERSLVLDPDQPEVRRTLEQLRRP